MWTSFSAAKDFAVLSVRMVPDVPFVEGDRHLLAAALACSNDPDGRSDRVDVGVGLVVEGKVLGRGFFPIGEIHLQRNVVDAVRRVFEYDGCPSRFGLL